MTANTALPATQLEGKTVEINWPGIGIQEYRTVVAAVPDSLGGVILTLDGESLAGLDDNEPFVTQLRVDVNDAVPDEDGAFRAARDTDGRPDDEHAFLVRPVQKAQAGDDEE